MTVRNHAILWLLLETGLSSSELCCLRLGDVDRVGGTVTVPEKRGHPRIFPLVSGWAARRVCLPGSGASHSGLGAHGASGAGPALAHGMAAPADQE